MSSLDSNRRPVEDESAEQPRLHELPRAINERIAAAIADLGVAREENAMLELVGERAQPSCRTRIHVPRELFEQVAGDAPKRFLMTPAHADGSTRVVEQRREFVVVELLESPVRLDGTGGYEHGTAA